MQVKISQASSMIAGFIRAKLVPMLSGSPGIGKSSIVHKIADEYKLKVIDLRLSQCDPTDLLGFPEIKDGKAGYVPMETFPLETDPIPEGYSGWLLFLDELNGASIAVQKAAYKLILDRMVGTHPLHKNVAIIGAGNKDTDNAAVEAMSTALQSRMVHMELVTDLEEFLDWAMQADFDHRITSYLKYKPGSLYTFRPDHSDQTYACPRTWEFANRILKITEDNSPDRLPMLSGAISEGEARELVAFMKYYDSLPKLEDVLSHPKEAKVPKEPSILYAMTGFVSHNMTKDRVEQLMIYVERLPMEFQIVCLKEAIKRNKELMGTPVLQKWLNTYAAQLF